MSQEFLKDFEKIRANLIEVVTRELLCEFVEQVNYYAVQNAQNNALNVVNELFSNDFLENTENEINHAGIALFNATTHNALAKSELKEHSGECDFI